MSIFHLIDISLIAVVDNQIYLKEPEQCKEYANARRARVLLLIRFGSRLGSRLRSRLGGRLGSSRGSRLGSRLGGRLGSRFNILSISSLDIQLLEQWSKSRRLRRGVKEGRCLELHLMSRVRVLNQVLVLIGSREERRRHLRQVRSLVSVRKRIRRRRVGEPEARRSLGHLVHVVEGLIVLQVLARVGRRRRVGEPEDWRRRERDSHVLGTELILREDGARLKEKKL